MQVTVKHSLFIESSAGSNHAGWRLKKGGTFPLEKFDYDTIKEAEEAAEKLQKYINDHCVEKQIEKRTQKKSDSQSQREAKEEVDRLQECEGSIFEQ